MARDMIEWLYGLQHFGIKLGLHNISALLEILDHPERAYRSALDGGMPVRFRDTGKFLIQLGLFRRHHQLQHLTQVKIFFT